MKWFLMALMFSSAGMADKLMVDVSSSTNDEINRTISFDRPPETINVFNRKKQYFDLGANGVKCDVSFFESNAVIGCEQTKDNKDRITAESGFQVAATADCKSGEEAELSFSNKTNKKGQWASFKIKIKCLQEKI